MIWWDFTNSEFLAFFIIVVSVFIFAAFFIISFIIAKRIDSGRQREIHQESNTLVIYVIDFKNSVVTSFYRYNIKRKIKMTLSEFYLRFAESDVDKLKNWLYNICVDNPAVDDYLEIDIIGKRSRIHYYSLLKKVNYDKETSILHLESHMLRYITPGTFSLTKKNASFNPLMEKEQLRDLIEKDKSLSGYTFCFRFYYSSIHTTDTDTVEKVLVVSLKNTIYDYARRKPKKRYIIDEDGNEIFLFDLDIIAKEDAVKLIMNINHDLKKVISIKGYSNYVSASVGIIENSQYYQDFIAMMRTSQQACIYAQQHTLPFYFHSRSSKVVLKESGKYSQEISRLIKPGSIQYSYRAIINATKGTAIGYICDLSAPESPFNNFMEMSKYSTKVSRNRELFAYISKNIVARYISERLDSRAKLFMPASFSDISFLSEVLLQIPNIDECRIALIFSERDLDESNVDIEEVYRSFEQLRDKHIECCLLLHDQNLLLDPQTYSYFQYFMIGGNMVKDIKRSNMSRLSIYGLAEQLLKYKKPIIANDLEGWSAIEYVVNSGIIYISSETISPYNALILPIDKKKAEKLVKIAEKYQ